MVDFAAQGLLDGLEGEARAQREELLRWLHDERGLPLDRIQAASAAGTLAILGGEDALGAARTCSQRALAEELGLELEFLEQLTRSQGLPSKTSPDAIEVSEVEAEAVRQVRRFLEAGLSPDQVLATSRVLGRGLGQAAELMRQQALALAVRPGATELELARAFTAMAEVLIPLVGPMIEAMLRVHLDHAVGAELVNEEERLSGALPGVRRVVVAFADLVGFTRLGEEVPPEELSRLALDLDVLAGQAVEAPVRHVKSIGDAVMLAGPDVDALLRSVFRLREAAEAAGLPPLRVGVASGDAVLRAGDVFGRPVNLASRIQGVARSGSVLVSEEVGRAADPAAWRTSFAGQRRLRGLPGEQRLFRVRAA